jgi:hypothetical protein
VRRASARGRRVRAFGEMVALLWAQGNAAATVRLEYLWNRVCKLERLPLFCAYPKAGFTQEASASLAEICAAHSRIIWIASWFSSSELSLDFGPFPRVIQEERRFLIAIDVGNKKTSAIGNSKEKPLTGSPGLSAQGERSEKGERRFQAPRINHTSSQIGFSHGPPCGPLPQVRVHNWVLIF